MPLAGLKISGTGSGAMRNVNSTYEKCTHRLACSQNKGEEEDWDCLRFRMVSCNCSYICPNPGHVLWYHLSAAQPPTWMKAATDEESVQLWRTELARCSTTSEWVSLATAGTLGSSTLAVVRTLVCLEDTTVFWVHGLEERYSVHTTQSNVQI